MLGRLFFFISLFSSFLIAQDKIEPELKENSEITAKIKALKSNESLFLPKPTIIEKIGDFEKGWHYLKEYGPEGRDYSLKMVWMPDRKRAFFCGANHGSPHRLNDAWEYDLASNSWVCLYTPDFNDSNPIREYAKDVLVLQDGWLRTKNGGPGHIAHTWSGLTYDPEQKAIIWLCFWPDYGLDNKLQLLGKTRKDLYKGPAVWMFYTQTKKWEPLPTVEPWPQEKYGFSLEYCPDIKQPVYHYAKNSYSLDVKNKSWKLTETNGEQYNMQMLTCYDTKNKQFVAHFGPYEKQTVRVTYTAKVENGSLKPWVKIIESNEGPKGLDHLTMLQYDSNSGDCFIFEWDTKLLWRLKPNTNKWIKVEPQGEKITAQHAGRLISYFDQERNVYVVLGQGWVWCYRP